jgi:hypothetical protein
VASQYLRSLKPELFQAVCYKNQSLPDFETIHKQVIEAAYQLRPTGHRPVPNLCGMSTGGQDPSPKSKPSSSNSADNK